MVTSRNVPPQNQNVLMGGGGGGNNSYLDATQLKELDVPMETVIGGANGAIKGAMLSGAASVVFSALTKGAGERGGDAIMRNLKGPHQIPIAIAVVAFTTLGAYVRNTKARLHNKWADQQTAIMEQETKSFAEKAKAEAAASAIPGAVPAR